MSTPSIAEAETKPGKPQATARKQPFARSRVGNGKALLAGIDQRSLAYREYQDVVADLTHHMGGKPTAVEQAIIEEAACLVTWCRQARAALLKGEEFSVAAYCTATNSLRRLLTDIGQERRLNDVTPPLSKYLELRAEAAGGKP